MRTVRELLARQGGKPPVVTHPDRRLEDVLETMLGEGLTSIPVVDHGKILGVLTLSEIIAAVETEKVATAA